MAGWLAIDGGAARDAPLWRLLEISVFLNVVLAVFNLIPVPPLDGSRIADAWMPDLLRPAWDALASLGPLGLVAVIALPTLLGLDWLGWPIAHARALLDAVFSLVEA